MLDHYYLRPKTADRVRALWLGAAIDQYAAWASERGAAKPTVTAHLQALIQFDRFAQSHGATRWTDLPTLIEPFVEHWMREHGTQCTGDRARQSDRSHARKPVEQMLRLLVPGFVGTTTRRPVPFQDTAPHFFDHLRQERGLRSATLYQYVCHLRVFEAYLRRFGSGALSEISPDAPDRVSVRAWSARQTPRARRDARTRRDAAPVSPVPPSRRNIVHRSESRSPAPARVPPIELAARDYLE